MKNYFRGFSTEKSLRNTALDVKISSQTWSLDVIDRRRKRIE
jgi:hypothetical protein